MPKTMFYLLKEVDYNPSDPSLIPTALRTGLRVFSSEFPFSGAVLESGNFWGG